MGKQFRQGLFGCCLNPKNCCCSFFCPCITVGNTAVNVGDSYSWCCCLQLICPWAPAIYLRDKVRHQYDIDGTFTEDVLVGLCCTCCSLAQTSVEVDVFMKR
ncbi:Protein PLANT CADMIUM RESISTANCE 2 [Thelohanellus kitauei]|uniref:Protein PLANT CADMIUM RESISTANCE 2 n=1 Tax=Thelohanellus kitauei TaxID=669202 RepID=A0A0C2JUK7_THEKT|nr:Protein PLANT CADMIUM RESISTANCE 2 [Thelohanellus kitauei]